MSRYEEVKALQARLEVKAPKKKFIRNTAPKVIDGGENDFDPTHKLTEQVISWKNKEGDLE